jgi:hypothetical protein
MDTQAVLKAGGAGAAVLVVLGLLGFIPCVGCITLPLSLIAYVGVGVLAAYWMILPRNTNSGAINGAVAAGVAALIAGIVSGVINAIYFTITGSAQFAEAFANLPPEQLEAFSELGLDPAMFAGGAGIVSVLVISSLCCVLWVVFAALLGAAGGAFWGSSHAS